MFVYQWTFGALDLKKNKGADYIIPWKSKRLFKSRFNPLCNAFFLNVKLFELKMEIQFNSTTLAVEQKLCNQNSKFLHCLWFRLLAKKSDLQFCIKRLLVWCH